MMNTSPPRAWLISEKRIVDVISIDFRDETISFSDNGDPFYLATRFFDEIIRMQSTGLFDNNQKEVFDRDIVDILFGERTSQHDTFKHRVTVFWDTQSLSWMCKQVYSTINSLIPSRLSAYHNAVYEVIGNIYANPELLETTK